MLKQSSVVLPNCKRNSYSVEGGKGGGRGGYYKCGGGQGRWGGGVVLV